MTRLTPSLSALAVSAPVAFDRPGASTDAVCAPPVKPWHDLHGIFAARDIQALRALGGCVLLETGTEGLQLRSVLADPALGTPVVAVSTAEGCENRSGGRLAPVPLDVAEMMGTRSGGLVLTVTREAIYFRATGPDTAGTPAEENCGEAERVVRVGERAAAGFSVSDSEVLRLPPLSDEPFWAS